jgi:hypothetical protein
MEVILRHKGYNTIESYLSLANKPEERAIILTQGRQLYNNVLNLPAMQCKLDRMFGDVLGGASFLSSARTLLVPGEDPQNQTLMKRRLEQALQRVAYMFGPERQQACMHALHGSNHLMTASIQQTLEAIKALGLVWSRDELKKLRGPAWFQAKAENDVIRDARIYLRNLFFMQCGVLAGGFENAVILKEIAEHAAHAAGMDGDFTSQIRNGIDKFDVLDLAREPKRNTGASSSHVDSEQFGGLQPSSSDAVAQVGGLLPSSSDATSDQVGGMQPSSSHAAPQQPLGGLPQSSSDAVADQGLQPHSSDAMSQLLGDAQACSSEGVPQQLGGFLASSSDAVSEHLGLMQTDSSDGAPQQLELRQLNAAVEDIHKLVKEMKMQQAAIFRWSVLHMDNNADE